MLIWHSQDDFVQLMMKGMIEVVNDLHSRTFTMRVKQALEQNV
jgi:hypothetical protein